MNVNDKKLVELPLECPDEVWSWLLKDAERFAAHQISRYRWRGAKRGVLPGGFDANSIAAQAIIEFLQPGETSTGPIPVDQAYLSEGSEDFPSQTPPQTIVPEPALTDLADVEEKPAAREALEADMPVGWRSECWRLHEELHHRVRRVVNRLWHLKERVLMHNVDDLAPVQTDDGETISPLENLPALDPNPQESLIREEDLATEEKFQVQFHAFLGKERALRSLYGCLCAGVSKQEDLARRLKVSTRAIKNRLRRLKRRAAAFSRLDGSERIKAGAKKVAAQILHLQGLAKAA